jgi:phage protein D
MGKRARQLSLQQRDAQHSKDLEKAEKRRVLEKEVAATRREKLVELLRSGMKLKKIKLKKGSHSLFPSCPCPTKIRRDEVVIDKHTESRKTVPEYRLEGDTGWV